MLTAEEDEQPNQLNVIPDGWLHTSPPDDQQDVEDQTQAELLKGIDDDDDESIKHTESK